MNTSSKTDNPSDICVEKFIFLTSAKANFVLSSVFLILVLASITGNALTILTIQNGKRLLNVKANYFILSLAYSDLVSGLIGPIGIYVRTYGFYPFNWGHLTCNVYWMLEEMSCLTTSIHISSFAVYRYFSVCHPIEENRLTNKRIKRMLMIQWIVSFICGFYVSFQWLGVRENPNGNKKNMEFSEMLNILKNPEIVTNQSKFKIHPQNCALKDHDDRHYVDVYIQMVYPIFYIFPMVLLIVTSTVICASISKRAYLSSRPKITSTASDNSGKELEVSNLDLDDVSDKNCDVNYNDAFNDSTSLQISTKIMTPSNSRKLKSPKPQSKRNHASQPNNQRRTSLIPPNSINQSSLSSTHLTSKEMHRLKCVKNRTRTVVIQLSMVVISYLIGYIPYMTYYWGDPFSDSNQCNLLKDYISGQIVYFCLKFSEACNPILYNIATGAYDGKIFRGGKCINHGK